MRFALCLVLLPALLGVALSPRAAAGQSADPAAGDPGLAARRQALRDLLAEHWDYTMEQNPEWASILGDKRWNDRSSDLSQAAIDAHLVRTREFLERFRAVDVAGFPEQEVLDRALMVRELEQELEGARFTPWRMPVNQISGIHLLAAQFPALLTFQNAKDYDDLLARYGNLPRQFGDTIDQMRRGLAEGLMPPRFLLEKVVTQAEAMAAVEPADSPFAQPLAVFPGSLGEEERERIRAAVLAAIRGKILPAYAAFARFVREEYAPRGRSEPGMWSLPDGQARYAFEVRTETTTDLTPDQIHQLGLREVARIEAEMLALGRRLGYDDLVSFEAAVEANPELRAKSGEQILDLYRTHIDAMYAKLPELFGRLPKAACEVRPIEEFRQQEAAGAEYMPPAVDGSRPGRVQVNTGDPTSRKIITMESTAYHEGVPGHHMQIAIAQELPELPEFRRHGFTTAYVEGWALYSERLGKEVGFYQDPYSDYGRLQDEILRAIRLVVDTGFHAKRWSREQVVEFFRDHSALDEVEIQSETDRYIVWPGQALAYKIGQLKILELRERASAALADRFDVRAFHDQVLGAGALPLDVLEARIDAWITAQQATATAAP